MLDNSLVSAIVLMAIVSWLFYRINLQVLAGGQMAAVIWLGVGVPLFAVSLALTAAMVPIPQSYIILGALAGVGNGMLGLGLRLLSIRRRSRSP